MVLSSFSCRYRHTSADNFTGTKFFHQLACTVDCCLCIIWVKTFFKFTGCICTKSDSLGRKTDVGSVKAAASNSTVCTSSVIMEFSPPMIPAIPTGFLTVTDHQNVSSMSLLSIQCYEFLIFSARRTTISDLRSYQDHMHALAVRILPLHSL